MIKNSLSSLLLASAFVIMCFAFQHALAQTSRQTFSFQHGQRVYITALRRSNEVGWGNSVYNNPTRGNIERHFYYDHGLGAEKQIRNRIEKWRYFTVVDKASESDFVLLVHVDSNAMEGVLLPLETYNQFREKFSNDSKIDFEALREAAYQRYLVGPFKIATLGRMSDRLVQRFREGVGKDGKKSSK